MATVLEDRLDLAIQQVGSTILGKEHAIRLALSCLLARGHLLIEDLPGMGKTTLAHALARCLGLQYQRIQFTSDLLPADILGAAVYERQRETFVFHPGPIFAQLILADEINRATPKTQSALLEAMEEGQVTIEGETRKLPDPFFVIATQNPAYQIGTFPLPESQLDRFLMRIQLGYPNAQAERLLLEGEDRREVLARLPACLTPAQLHEAQARVTGIHAASPLLDYIQALLTFSRQSSHFRGGLSPRAGLALLRAARAWALLHRRSHVLPEDVQTVLPAVVGHRLHPSEDHLEQSTSHLVERLRAGVALPL
ncbi:MAG: AAA family ATPase [Candidatus Competibacteraceae bacterium]|nr:AAA family ATPase [Candidatus Competibacteraceae bacterium]